MYPQEEVLVKIGKMEGTLHYLKEAVSREDIHTIDILLDILDETSKELNKLHSEKVCKKS